MKFRFGRNESRKDILIDCLFAAFSLFINGFGIYLTILANIGVSPWDVLNIGCSKTFNVLYGTASIIIALTILVIDVLMKEVLGIAMFIDALVVGKSVDFFNYLGLFKTPSTLLGSIIMMFIGLAIIGYTQYTYMLTALGCGPRDTLLVGLNKIFKKVPIGVVSICLLSLATFIGYLLGGPVGIGTIICALCAGPIMQKEMELMHFKAVDVKHQKLQDTIKILLGK